MKNTEKAQETIIKEYARIAYVKKNQTGEDIIKEINEMYNSRYTIRAFNKWKIEGEWDLEIAKNQAVAIKNNETLKKIPSIEAINEEQISGILENQKTIKNTILILEEKINELNTAGEDFNNEVGSLTKLTNAYKDNAVAIDKLGNKTILGNHNKDITIIVSNFLKDQENITQAEVIE